MNVDTRPSGQGGDIVLLHGWGFDARVWQPVCDLLDRDFRLTCVDLPGYGSNRDQPIGSFAETVDAIIESLPEGSTLVGWSLGGMLAIACVLRRRPHFSRLVLVASTPSFMQREGWPFGVAPAMLAGFRLALRAGGAGLIKRFSGLINHGDQNARDLTRLFALLGEDAMPGEEALLQGLDWLRDLDLRSALPRLDLPVLVIHGGNDPLMAIAGAQAMAASLPNGRLETFPAAAHAPFFSDPERFAQCLREFVALPVTVC
jgi:pimeloyl-[acyl-carrier protein] methyl ester esterase